MNTMVRCVCGCDVGDDAPRIDGRVFCERHYRKATTSRRGMIFAVIGGTVAALAEVGVFWLLGRWIAPGTLSTSTIGGVVCILLMTAFPVAVWAFVLSRADSIEPEPPSYLVGVFVAAGLAAQAIGITVFRLVLDGPIAAVRNSPLSSLACDIFGYGLVQGFLVYAAIRCTVFRSAEFDERMDGLVYGSLAGLGVAFVQNLNYVASLPSLDLGIAATRVAVGVLLQAGTGALIGWFMAGYKFDSRPWWWIPLGVVGASVISGAGAFLCNASAGQGLNYKPGLGLLLATIIAGVMFTFILAYSLRQNRAALASTREAT